jgi:hypothetical protein
MTKGYLIVAQNTTKSDYIECAKVLAASLKHHMPDCSVSLLTGEFVEDDIFDNIIPFPYGDLDPKGKWKLINDWQVYEASPYDETIKLEADLFITSDISYWWDVLGQQDVVISTTIRNFQGEISDSKVYRRFITDNNLPDTYNALTYFRKSETAEEFFKLVRHIFENWTSFRSELKCSPTEFATTDWVYAIASHLIGVEKTTMPIFTDFSMVHMKQFINNLVTEDWAKELIVECHPEVLRINTHPQRYPFHYQDKKFSKVLKEHYGTSSTLGTAALN